MLQAETDTATPPEVASAAQSALRAARRSHRQERGSRAASRRPAPLLPPAPAAESRPAACYLCRRTRAFERLSVIVFSLMSLDPSSRTGEAHSRRAGQGPPPLLDA